jgi:signal peptidase I
MTSEKKATRSQKKGAKEILRLGLKTLSYRCDLLPQDEVDTLRSTTTALQESLSVKSVTGGELEKKAKAVDEALQKSGGLYYHKKGWVENIEMLLVAAIVVIGIRSFFLQPFIIPTNSMYPSFFGMQPHVYETDDEPNFAGRAIDKLLLGASHYKLEAQSSGDLYLVAHRQVTSTFPNGRFFLIPTVVNEYVFEIGGKEHLLQVPAEFDLNQLLAQKFAGIDDLNKLDDVVTQDLGYYKGSRLKLSDRTYKEGDVVLAFDILLGDALFVDRFTYNFIKPKAGDPAVFRTGTIDQFNRELGTFSQNPDMNRTGEDKYYIKRLVGEPGDELQLTVPQEFHTKKFIGNKNFANLVVRGDPGILKRNSQFPLEQIDEALKILSVTQYGQAVHDFLALWVASVSLEPTTGNIAFDENRLFVESLIKDPNATSENGYPGYQAEGLLSDGDTLILPTKNSIGNPTGQNAYFAMGDNSINSMDGRSWGFVPEKAIIGRALLIYYPFTKRWGFAK